MVSETLQQLLPGYRSYVPIAILTSWPYRLYKSIQALQQEHPVLRMGVEYQDNVAKFVEASKPTVALTTAPTLYPNWQSKLQEFANEFRDWSETVLFADLASNGEQHQLFLTVNHAGDVSWSLTKVA